MCDYILVDLQGKPWPITREELRIEVERIKADKDTYGLISSVDGVYLFANTRKLKQGKEQLQGGGAGVK
jgi:hypothetical protein